MSSFVWKHFKKSEDGTRSVCSHCDASLSYGSGNTSSMKRHLELKHSKLATLPVTCAGDPRLNATTYMYHGPTYLYLYTPSVNSMNYYVLWRDRLPNRVPVLPANHYPVPDTRGKCYPLQHYTPTRLVHTHSSLPHNSNSLGE